MFRAPFASQLLQWAGELSEGQEKTVFLHKTFSGKSGKRIDEAKCECSLRNLSLNWERFFEIYFVRLIGTPNQHIPS